MTRIITSLKCCNLGLKIWIKLVFVMKNWPNNPRLGCTTRSKSIEEYLEIENGMVLDNEDLIFNFIYKKKRLTLCDFFWLRKKWMHSMWREKWEPPNCTWDLVFCYFDLLVIGTLNPHFVLYDFVGGFRV